MPTDASQYRDSHPYNNWMNIVGEDIKTYKQVQKKTFLPQVSEKVLKDKKEMSEDIKRKFQFTTLNCEPYHREQKKDFGVCKLHNCLILFEFYLLLIREGLNFNQF